MRRTGDQALVKEINTSIVLETIIRDQPISRASISLLTGLNKGTVSSLVQELIERHLVFETGTGLSSGGRKPVLLKFQQNTGYAVGVDLGVNFVHTVLTDLNGNVIREHTASHHNENEQNVTQLLIQTIRHVLSEKPESHYGLIGIGVGIPGIVDSDGQILFAPNLGWKNRRLGDQLKSQFNVPVHVDNEANAGAIGEQQYGANSHTPDMIFISAGIGIGSGIILGNEIYRGSSGFSGEIGHLTIDSDGRLCRCGNRGCWELYASENALIAKTAKLMGCEVDSITLEDIIVLAKDNDSKVLDALQQIGRYLGIGIAGMINIFNPKLIIIGNRLTKASPWLEDAINQEIETRALTFHRRSVRVEFSKLQTHSTALGAAYMAISSFLHAINSAEKN